MPVKESPSGPRIVTGVDGSESSVSALRWAIRQAGLTGAAVDAVIAWHYPDLAASGMVVGAMQPPYGIFQESAADRGRARDSQRHLRRHRTAPAIPPLIPGGSRRAS